MQVGWQPQLLLLGTALSLFTLRTKGYLQVPAFVELARQQLHTLSGRLRERPLSQLHQLDGTGQAVGHKLLAQSWQRNTFCLFLSVSLSLSGISLLESLCLSHTLSICDLHCFSLYVC